MSTLNTALALASRGHAVLALHWPVRRNGRLCCSCGKAECPSPAKHPLGKTPDGSPLAVNGLLSATTEIAIVKLWWLKAPEANLGVRTDRLLVLDVDDRHDGEGSLRRLEDKHGPLPATWRALTGGGGQHIFFAEPEYVEITSWGHPTAPLGPGIDGRARGGYVVAPGSLHVSGRSYAWDVDNHPAHVPLAQAPAWLIEILAPPCRAGERPRGRVPSEEWRQLTAQMVTEYRDLAAARIIGSLFRHDVDPDLAVGLLAGWNARFCHPPLSDFDLERIVERIARRERERMAAHG